MNFELRILLIVLLFLLIFAVRYFQLKRISLAKTKITKLIEKSGATNIKIDARQERRGDLRFIATFQDAVGQRQVRTIDSNLSQIQHDAFEIEWREALADTSSAPTDSKEQIITDLSAEIDQLRAQLDDKRGDSAESSPLPPKS